MPDIDKLKIELQKTLEHLQTEFSQIRTGRATTELIEGVIVKAYESEMPITNVANIMVSDVKTLTVEPWDKSIVENVAAGINNANLGLGVSVDGAIIRVSVPDLTTERRQEYVKIMKERVEEARKTLRNIRRSYLKDLDESVKEGFPEEDAKRIRDEIEKVVKEFDQKTLQMRDEKEKALLAV